MRTLAFAAQYIDPDGNEGDLTFVGMVGIADPVRPDVKDAIDMCQGNAGVRVIMVTGDVAVTANEIGRELGIINDGEDDLTLSGQSFEEMSDEQAIKIIPRLKILSRAKPEDKARLVTLLQRMGEVVAVTGDGTNDAPALKKGSGRFVNGRRHGKGERGKRHHHNRQFVLKHQYGHPPGDVPSI